MDNFLDFEKPIADLEGKFLVTDVTELTVPGVEGQRHLLRLVPDIAPAK